MRVCHRRARGGGLGSRLVARLRSELGQVHNIVALGTNTVAAAAMKRAGATQVGVGPHAIADTLPTADVIVSSLNLVLPGAMLGEVTPEIVHAILGARATKVLLPLNRAHVEIVGGGGAHPRGVDYAVPVPGPFLGQFSQAHLAGSLRS